MKTKEAEAEKARQKAEEAKRHAQRVREWELQEAEQEQRQEARENQALAPSRPNRSAAFVETIAWIGILIGVSATAVGAIMLSQGTAIPLLGGLAVLMLSLWIAAPLFVFATMARNLYFIAKRIDRILQPE